MLESTLDPGPERKQDLSLGSVDSAIHNMNTQSVTIARPLGSIKESVTPVNIPSQKKNPTEVTVGTASRSMNYQTVLNVSTTGSSQEDALHVEQLDQMIHNGCTPVLAKMTNMDH